MKKIFLGIAAISMSLVLVACGNTQSNAAINNLGKQLDETANTISSLQTINPNELTMTKSMLEQMATKESIGAIYDNVINTQQSLLNEEYYKTDILNKTAQIKNKLSTDLKLSKAQTSAVKDLTNSLSKYTNSVAYTKNELNNSIKSISSLKKHPDKNNEKISAKLSRLACNSNARSSYFENIIHTLNQIETCLNCDNCETCEDCKETESQESTNSQMTETKTDNQQTNNGLTKNIDTYLPKQTSKEVKVSDETNNTFLQPQQPAYPNPSINQPNVYNRYNRFNPTRNTDTYGPGMRNIDTYRPNNFDYNNGIYGNPAYGYNSNFNNPYNYSYGSNNMNRATFNGPNTALVNAENNSEPKAEQRLEDFEKINEEDQTIEKVSPEEIAETKQETSEKIQESAQTINSTVEKVKEEVKENSNDKATEDKKVEDSKPLKTPRLRVKDLRKNKENNEQNKEPVVVALNKQETQNNLDINSDIEKLIKK